MLGWEYPPHISGGLGTACEGLTTALAKNGVGIEFVVPRVTGDERVEHMRLVKAEIDADEISAQRNPVPKVDSVTVHPIPALLRPYETEVSYATLRAEHERHRFGAVDEQLRSTLALLGGAEQSPYGRNLFAEVERYTEAVLERSRRSSFDLIHAHDWMTFPAAVALKAETGAPLVIHVHSLEFDRCGASGDRRIEEIERFGLEHADLVIAVSYMSRGLIHQHYGVPLDKIFVVHNGVYGADVVQPYRRARGWPTKVVLFLGRITFQKGPEYFVEAAAKVVPRIPDALFVMAGTGDLLPRMIDRVKQLGLTDNFYFPGFLRGQEVEQIFSLADVYVMPSVSEPFGIAALEAISFETPVIISRQSGVSEVLSHALTVDYWDTNHLAELIVQALTSEELRREMVAVGREELRRVRWDAAAQKTIDLYRMLI